MSFDEIRNQAIAEKEALEKSDKVRILVGTATCGRAAGAMGVMEMLEKELSRLGIDAIVSEVGCIGLCYAEPLIEVVNHFLLRSLRGVPHWEPQGGCLSLTDLNDSIVFRTPRRIITEPWIGFVPGCPTRTTM